MIEHVPDALHEHTLIRCMCCPARAMHVAALPIRNVETGQAMVLSIPLCDACVQDEAQAVRCAVSMFRPKERPEVEA